MKYALVGPINLSCTVGFHIIWHKWSSWLDSSCKNHVASRKVKVAKRISSMWNVMKGCFCYIFVRGLAAKLSLFDLYISVCWFSFWYYTRLPLWSKLYHQCQCLNQGVTLHKSLSGGVRSPWTHFWFHNFIIQDSSVAVVSVGVFFPPWNAILARSHRFLSSWNSI